MIELTTTQWIVLAVLAAVAVAGLVIWAISADHDRRRALGETRELHTGKDALQVDIQQAREGQARAEAERVATQQQLLERDEVVRQAKEESGQLSARIEVLSAESQALQSGKARTEAERDALSAQLQDRDVAAKQAQEEHRQLNARIAELMSDVQALTSGRERAEADRDALREQLKARDEADKQAKADRKLERTTMLGQLSERFQVLASQALEQKREAVQGAGEQAVKLLIDPLQKDLKTFREKIELSYGQAGHERTELKTLVEQLNKASIGLGDEARQLTRALKGESQTRGYWGEMILQTLLEDAGLVQGQHYVSQQTFRDEDGKGKRPDVVLQLPGNRYVVIDAKVSLNAYERAVATEDTKVRDREMRAHVKSITRHITGLAAKKYQELAELEGKNPDFVFLFVPLEAAYIAAYQAEPRLLQQARDRKIALLSPATLLPVLLMVSELWRVELRNRNAEEIAKVAGQMYDKFSRFLESYDKMGQKINNMQFDWEEGRKRLSEGRGNVLLKIDKLKQLGARTTKSLPQIFADTLVSSDVDDSSAEVQDAATPAEAAVAEAEPLAQSDADAEQVGKADSNS